MDKDTFSKLKVADIKALFETEQALEILSLAQQDDRSSVQKLAASYIKRQEKELKEQQRLMSMYDYEGMFYDQGMYHVAGVDEVGRGPIAGPVTVAAVILPPMTLIPCLNDSKKLTEEKRETLYDIIMKSSRSRELYFLTVQKRSMNSISMKQHVRLCMRRFARSPYPLKQ